ncbi:MAG TPA: hypothetical protein VF756_19455 [Thermoanaerobaculia bacterium]
MPKIALADTLREWESLLTGAKPYADASPLLKEFLAGLEASLDRTRGLDHLRTRLAAESQRATQQLREERENGQEKARQIRSLLRGGLGSTNKELVRFGMRPARGPKGAKMREPLFAKPADPPPEAAVSPEASGDGSEGSPEQT